MSPFKKCHKRKSRGYTSGNRGGHYQPVKRELHMCPSLSAEMWGSSAMLKPKMYPSFFTAGAFSTEGPTRQQVMEGTTKIVLYGKGWKDKLSEPTDQHTAEPDTQMKLTITGPEPAYPFTAMCMVQAGLTIIEETDKLPLE
ncbi:hypothetical protein AVEN_54221-1 [Araneus ventricosus]|uniref:Uncharacterized protein n=1 Tax=Araneus ventricosus TaxID=182803 RepID=A0A4Y2UHR5_ARAVE|nr:hypothetical protein AVEN_54221-1 [Araneus ventricosus]